MLIQNTTGAVSQARFASDHTATAVASPKGDAPPVQQSPTVDTYKPSIAQLENAVRDLNQSMKASNSNLAFSIDQDTQQTIVKVMDSKTGETIKQFPSKEAIAIAKAIGDIQQGLLLKQKA
ncbi:MAG: flagellar protein FlaG [Gallionellaceae bacterium]|nr:MAG: flagellar protein FlaG [Gallionellaceae bacterium]